MHLRNYHRADTVSLEVVLPKIEEFFNKEHRYKVNINGYRVNISSKRLKTFLSNQSCPCCHINASFFAIEKNYKKFSLNGESKRGYHLNLYGLDKDGNEILFTHDHTLARGLGGEDELHNTVTMCSPCNSHKGQLESRIKNTKSEKYKIVLEEAINSFLENGIKINPPHPEPQVDVKLDSKAYKKKMELKMFKKLIKKSIKSPDLLTTIEKAFLKQKEEEREKQYEYKRNNQPKI